ncbi:MAG: right-handed parallel beta-helix repeat-containing protein [Sandaracinaceae bacterium]|nr:right-handed parallel beta-helix repeat-containing protein [Sandaracinaceae bacterium]
MLLRRGGDFGDEALVIRSVRGTDAQPITVGAYGLPEDGRPVISIAGIDGGSAFVTLRDVELRPHASSCAPGVDCHPCLTVNSSSDVVIEDLYVHDCFSNGIVIGAGAERTAVVGSRIANVHANDGITIHDGEADEPDVGDHHWIADNVIGPMLDDAAEQGIDVAVGGGAHGVAHDVKIVGNSISSIQAGCVMTAYQIEHTWIVANVMGNCPLAPTNAAIHVGNEGGGSADVRGNLLFRNRFANLVASHAGATVRVVRNTFLPDPNERGTWRFTSMAATELMGNVIGASPDQQHVLTLASGTEPYRADDNWYLPRVDGSCAVFGGTLAEWQVRSGLDGRSRCEAVPGLDVPLPTLDPEALRDPSFLGAFVPDPGWAGCDRGIGGIGCDGAPVVEWIPFDDLSDNAGLGWPGPRTIRQRYPLPRE